VKSVSRLMIILSFVECCFALSDVPRQVFGYNAECDQATLYLTTCCVNISCKHVSTSQKLIIIFARQTDLLVSYIYNCHHKYLKSRNTNDESWTVRTRRTNSSDFQLCRTLICHRTRSVSICQLIFVIMCIYFCDLLYFLYTDSSVQGMSTVSYSELMLMSFCFSFLLRCGARRVIVRLDKLAYPKPMYMRLCSRMLFCMECFTLWQVCFPLWTLRLLIWQHEEQFVLLFVFLWLLVYIFVWFIVFLVRQF